MDSSPHGIRRAFTATAEGRARHEITPWTDSRRLHIHKYTLARRGRHIGNAAHDDGKLDRVAQHAAPMQPAQPPHRIGIAGIPGIKLGIPLLQKPAARPDRESRDRTRDYGEGQMTRHSKGYRPDDTGNAQHQKMRIEHAAQQPADLGDLKLHQQEGGRGQKELAHRKKQDDNGGQGDGV